MSTAKQKTSSVWSYYSEECRTPFHKCAAKIKRGKYGNRKSMEPPLDQSCCRHRKAIDYRDKADKPENVQKLLFLKYNLRMLNYNL